MFFLVADRSGLYVDLQSSGLSKLIDFIIGEELKWQKE